ncbi:transcription repressor OFP13-like [Bidens hawaiensis]|uniref:transcription repressor OFP13-like n=1 Tax=Bidens hawaiensis TaxID=980011 RepID=UPI0040499FE9
MGKANMNPTPSLFLLNKRIWLWPSCNNHPKTLSFRAVDTDHRLFMNPNYKESLVESDQVELATLGSCFTNSSEYSPSISSDSDSSAVETIVRGARSKRLFFEPYSTSCSILEAQVSADTGSDSDSDSDSDRNGVGGGGLVYKESVAMVMETENPYVDFRKSMEEMVEMHELKEWDCLEELLGWYLRMNDKDNHEVIVGAFFDLLADGCRHGDGGGGGGDGGVSCLDHSTTSCVTSASTCSSPTLFANGNNK